MLIVGVGSIPGRASDFPPTRCLVLFLVFFFFVFLGFVFFFAQALLYTCFFSLMTAGPSDFLLLQVILRPFPH